MNEGYMALTVSILRNVTPEVAFKMLQGDKYRKWTANDVPEIEMMRQSGMTWREIGRNYGVTEQAACSMYYYQKKKIESKN